MPPTLFFKAKEFLLYYKWLFLEPPFDALSDLSAEDLVVEVLWAGHLSGVFQCFAMRRYA